VEFIAFDDLDGGLQAELYAIGEGLARVTSIHQYAIDEREIGFATVEGVREKRGLVFSRKRTS